MIHPDSRQRAGRLNPWKVASAGGMSLLLLLGQSAPVLGNPTGGAVVAGSATIGSAGSTLTINQSSHNAIINWQQFSIARGELTKFLVPNSSSATLNRVLGGNPSAIYGDLRSNGILYLVNPNGIVVGPNGQIDAASFLASTLDVSDGQFLKGGNLRFAGGSDASIDNQGAIEASSGGVYLIANQVTNDGVLSAAQGSVGLAAGSDVLFQQAGSQHLFVKATPAGATRAAGVTNAGTIRAAAAELVAAGGNAYALAINNTGSIAATGYKKVRGQVYLTSEGGDITNSGQISARKSDGNGGKIVLDGYGTTSKGTVLNSGSLVATGQAPGKVGGTVEVLGNLVGIMDHGSVDVSGDAGGGTALIGGDEHGSNPAIADADHTYLGPDATINANALTLGLGGKVILWGNLTTQVYGQISATGGARGGNGGFVETSGASVDARTAPDLSSFGGTRGTWLLDPSTVTISDAVQNSGFNMSPAFTITSGVATINQDTLLSALATGNVTIDAGMPSAENGGDGAGTITWTQSNGAVATDVTNSSDTGSILTLSAPNQITIDDVSLSFTGNKVSMVINSSGSSGPVSIQNTTLSLNGGSFVAFGTGNSSQTTGVAVSNSTINAQGGSISLTGQGTYINEGGGSDSVVTNGVQIENVAGNGVSLNNSLVESTGTGDIALIGDGSPGTGVTAVNDLIGVEIVHSVLSVENGTLGIMGTVSNGTASAVTGTESGRALGVFVVDGSSIESTGTGSVSIIGDTTGSTAEISNVGVEISGLGAAAGSGSDPIVTTTVSAAGGSGITITGNAGAIDDSPSGSNVQTPTTAGIALEFGTDIAATGSAPISLNGTAGNDENTSSAGLTGENSIGIGLDAYDNGGGGDSYDVSILSANGAIVLNGTGGNSIGSVDGIALDSSSGAAASITSTGANISLTGHVTNTATQLSTGGGVAGVDIGVDDASGAVSNVTALAGSILIQGTVTGGTANSREGGVVISNGAQIIASGTGGTAGTTAQGDVTIIGTTTGTTAQTINGGVFIDVAGTVVEASGIVADGLDYQGLTILGTAGGIDGTTGTTIDRDNGTGGTFVEPITAGIGIIDGANLETLGSAKITLIGAGGTNANTLDSTNSSPYVNATTGSTSGSYGVAVFSPVNGQTTGISSGGDLSIVGTAGSSPTTGVGVLIGGPSNSGAVDITSAGSITITGTGGAGNVTGSPVPNAGVAIFDPGNASSDDAESGGTIRIAASGGDLAITGTSGGGPNSTAVDGIPYFNTVDDLPSNDPELTASGTLSFTSEAGLINTSGMAGELTAQNMVIVTPDGTNSTIATQSSAGPLSLYGGSFTVQGYSGALLLATSAVQSLTLTNNGAVTLGTLDYDGTLDINSDGALSINGAIAGSGAVTVQDTGGNITFGPGGSISDSGGNVVLAAGTELANSYSIINDSNAGSNAIRVSSGSYFYLYSNAPVSDVFGGLTVAADNVVYNATYPTVDLPAANEELFYTGSGGGTGNPTGPSGSTSPTEPSSETGGADGSGSNLVPPAITPQQASLVVTPSGTGDFDNAGSTAPFDFVGSGISGATGAEGTGLASSSGSASQIGSGDEAQIGNGQLNNIANPAAAGQLNLALSPVVYQSLQGALASWGQWTAADLGSGGTAGAGETILSGGDMAEVAGGSVKSIPPDQAPPQLLKAMGDDVARAMGTSSGR